MQPSFKLIVKSITFAPSTTTKPMVGFKSILSLTHPSHKTPVQNIHVISND